MDTQKALEEVKTTKETIETQLKGNTRKEAEIIALTAKNAELESKITKLNEDYTDLRREYDASKKDNLALAAKVSSFGGDKMKLENEIKTMEQTLKQNAKHFVTKLMQHSVKLCKATMNKEIELGFTSVNCTPQYFCVQIETLQANLEQLQKCTNSRKFTTDLFDSSLGYFFQLYYLTNCAKTFIQTIPNIETSDGKCLWFLLICRILIIF